jgi:hypothetical protein
MRISIRSIREDKSTKAPKVPSRLGPEEEAYVRDYIINPTQEKRDWIVLLSERIIKQVYKKYKVPYDYRDFYNDAVVHILDKILPRFKPDKGCYVNWLMVNLDGFAKTKRFNHKRYLKTQHCLGLHPKSLPEEEYVESLARFLDTEESIFKAMGKGEIHKILDQLVIRFTGPSEMSFCRDTVSFLKKHGRFPTFKESHDAHLHLKDLNLEDLYFFHRYIKVVCHSHFLKHWSEYE